MMTFLPDLMSSRLLTVVMSTQPTTRVITGQKVTCQSLQGLVLTNSYVFSEFEDSVESPRELFFIDAAVMLALEPLETTGRICL